MKLFIIVLVVVFVGMSCHQVDDDIQYRFSDSLHTLSKERFNRYSDSMNTNMNRSLNFMVTRQPDSSLFYGGKMAAYMEMETKELRK